MNREEIIAKLKYWGDMEKPHEAVLQHFCVWMKDCQYGGPETVDAFLHFNAGWNAAAYGKSRP